jgi:hypothetical protein
MMDDFELETRQKKIYNGIRNKWRAMNKLYTEKIEEMKAKNEKMYKERDRQFKKNKNERNVTNETIADEK